MSQRGSLGLALSCSVLLLAGCGPPAEPAPSVPQPDTGQVTVHVPDMTRRLELTCPD
jgi:hypothetical protein